MVTSPSLTGFGRVVMIISHLLSAAGKDNTFFNSTAACTLPVMSGITKASTESEIVRVCQSHMGQLEMLFGKFSDLICQVLVPAYNRLSHLHDHHILRYCNGYQNPFIAALFQKCDIWVIALKVLAKRNGRITYEIHLLIFGYYRW